MTNQMFEHSRRKDDEQIVDVGAFLQRVDSDYSLATELVDLFLLESPGLMDQAMKALAAGDSPALACAAHTLKGALANFSAQRAVNAASVLERLGRERNMTEARFAFDKLREEMRLLNNEFPTIVGELSGYNRG